MGYSFGAIKWMPIFNYMKTTLRNGRIFLFPQNVDLVKSGIYKISFDNYFYIGSTLNFKKRMSCLRTSCGSKGKPYNKKMAECLKLCTVISFEIIQIVEDVLLLRSIETEIINSFKGNPFLINRAFDAVSNNGIKWTDEERLKISKGKKNKPKSKQTKLRMRMSHSGLSVINKYSITGDFISSYSSCKAAALDSQTSHTMVIKVINKVKDSHNGFVFKREYVLKKNKFAFVE